MKLEIAPYIHSDANRDYLNDHDLPKGSAVDIQRPPMVTAPRAEINIVCDDGLDSKGFAPQSSLLDTDHVSVPVGIDSRPNVHL